MLLTCELRITHSAGAANNVKSCSRGFKAIDGAHKLLRCDTGVGDLWEDAWMKVVEKGEVRLTTISSLSSSLFTLAAKSLTLCNLPKSNSHTSGTVPLPSFASTISRAAFSPRPTFRTARIRRAGLYLARVFAASYPSPLRYAGVRETDEKGRMECETYTFEPVTITMRPVKSGQSTGGRGVNCERRKDARVNFMVCAVDDTIPWIRCECWLFLLCYIPVSHPRDLHLAGLICRERFVMLVSGIASASRVRERPREGSAKGSTEAQGDSGWEGVES